MRQYRLWLSLSTHKFPGGGTGKQWTDRVDYYGRLLENRERYYAEAFDLVKEKFKTNYERLLGDLRWQFSDIMRTRYRFPAASVLVVSSGARAAVGLPTATTRMQACPGCGLSARRIASRWRCAARRGSSSRILKWSGNMVGSLVRPTMQADAWAMLTSRSSHHAVSRISVTEDAVRPGGNPTRIVFGPSGSVATSTPSPSVITWGMQSVVKASGSDGRRRTSVQDILENCPNSAEISPQARSCQIRWTEICNSTVYWTFALVKRWICASSLSGSWQILPSSLAAAFSMAPRRYSAALSTELLFPFGPRGPMQATHFKRRSRSAGERSASGLPSAKADTIGAPWLSTGLIRSSRSERLLPAWSRRSK